MLTSGEMLWLIAAIAKGDLAAFERLYVSTCAKLYGIVLRILRQPEVAAIITEEAYLRIWRGAGQFDPAQSTPITWMVAIARNLAIDHARRPQQSDTPPDADLVDVAEAQGAAPQHELTEELKKLLTCIGRLEPERQRMVLLAYYGGFSRDQLSAELDMPINLLKTSLRRTLFEIEQCLTA
jgi:RNA polymerase sigma-70 factor (ECF subfamily)